MKFKLATAAAAVLVSATASQAADLAKKAPVAVDYVKVCDAYGAGFFYIPGTDTCLKIGGYIRAQVVTGDDDGYYGNFGGGRSTNNYNTTGRLHLNVDARSQTEYGVLRGYGAVHLSAGSTSAKGEGFELDKAYIQFAGFTAGYAASFFDFWTGYSVQFNYGGVAENDESRNLLAYTFGFGNGLSASLSVEDGYRTGRIGEVGALAYTIADGADTDALPDAVSVASLAYGGNKAPDIVGQLKLAQAWGSAQISAVAHNQYAANYDIDQWGYAVLAGVEFNLPMFGAGDKLALQATYGKGALAYVSDNLAKSPAYVSDYNWSGDESTAWAIGAGFKHVFNPNWAFNIDAGYADLDAADGLQDLTQWDVGASVVWTPVTNLNINFGLEYRSTDVSGVFADPDALSGLTSAEDGDGWNFGIRVNRVF